MFGRWRRRREEHRANKQVEAGGVVMSGPAGAPRDDDPRARDGE
jgi:hypothetical protein